MIPVPSYLYSFEILIYFRGTYFLKINLSENLDEQAEILLGARLANFIFDFVGHRDVLTAPNQTRWYCSFVDAKGKKCAFQKAKDATHLFEHLVRKHVSRRLLDGVQALASQVAALGLTCPFCKDVMADAKALQSHLVTREFRVGGKNVVEKYRQALILLDYELLRAAIELSLLGPDPHPNNSQNPDAENSP